MITVFSIILSFITGFLAAFIILKSQNAKLEIDKAKLEEKIKTLLENSKTKEEYSELIKKEFTNLQTKPCLKKIRHLMKITKKILKHI